MVSYTVVGASRNLGLGFVQCLSSRPENKVFALVRNKTTATQLDEFVKPDSNKHGNVTVLEADLDDFKTIKAAAAAVSQATGGELDVLINNGALLHHERNRMSLDEFPDEETLEQDLITFFETNVVGATHAINAFLPLLRAAALNMVVAKFATRFKDEGFMFVAVSPGLIKTMPGPPDVVDKIYEGDLIKLRKFNPNFGFVTVEQSVRDQLSLLERLTPADTGAFLHANGNDANTVSY